MSRLVVEVPKEELDLLGWSEVAAGNEIKLAAAMQLYGQGRLSAGEAAQFAGTPVTVFLARRADFNVPPYELIAEELQAELDAIEH